jgi:hypothetical protein
MADNSPTFGLVFLATGVTFVVAGWKDWSVTEILTGKHEDKPAEDRLPGLGGVALSDVAQSTPLENTANPAGGGLLTQLAYTAQNQFSLNVREYCPKEHCFGVVHRVHVPTSLHYKGRAFDASGSVANMRAFAAYVDDNFGANMTELFWNGPGARNRKNGQREPAGFVSGHTDHVHCAI